MLDLPTIVDRFAEGFDGLALVYPGRPDYRVLIVTCTLVATAVVVGQCIDDDTIVLLGIEIDRNWP